MFREDGAKKRPRKSGLVGPLGPLGGPIGTLHGASFSSLRDFMNLILGKVENRNGDDRWFK